jgi:hypothetical protein
MTRYMSKRQYFKISSYPDLVQQLAWQVADMYKQKLQVNEVKVFAYLSMSLNNREPALVIDPTVDLGATRTSILHDPWLTPTNPNPLRRIEQVKIGDLEKIPTLPELLNIIGLPKPQHCFPGGVESAGLHEVAVCSLAGADNWNTQL